MDHRFCWADSCPLLDGRWGMVTSTAARKTPSELSVAAGHHVTTWLDTLHVDEVCVAHLAIPIPILAIYTKECALSRSTGHSCHKNAGERHNPCIETD